MTKWFGSSRAFCYCYGYFRSIVMVKMETLVRFFFVAATLVALSLVQGVQRNLPSPVKISLLSINSSPPHRDRHAAGLYPSAYATCGATARAHALCAPRGHLSWTDGRVTHGLSTLVLQKLFLVQTFPTPAPASSVLSTCAHIYLGTARW